MTAEGYGRQPNRWFFDVERAVQVKNGDETVRSVTNVSKYRFACQHGEAILQGQGTSRGGQASGGVGKTTTMMMAEGTSRAAPGRGRSPLR